LGVGGDEVDGCGGRGVCIYIRTGVWIDKKNVMRY